MTTERPPAPAPLLPHETEEVILAQLTAPDRPLRNLMARLNAIVKSKDAMEIAQATTSFTLELESFLLKLNHIEAVAHETTVQEVHHYQQQVMRINEERQSAIEAIAALKRELVQVQQERQNKLEYDALANEIMKYKTRDELNASLTSLGDTIATMDGEASKYDEDISSREERFESIMTQLEAIHAEVGYEVGERERRAVERGGEGEAEEEADTRQTDEGAAMADGEQEATSEADQQQQQQQQRASRSSLNPSAPTFKPSLDGISRASTPGATRAKRTRSGRRRRGGVDADMDAMDEDGQERSKKAHIEEEGEMSDGNAGADDDEEEEGAA